jgi:hypothetical protein
MDRELRIKSIGGRRNLRFKISEVRNPETVRAVDLRRIRGRGFVTAEKVRFES